MLLLGIFIGLGVSICLWVWYNIQFNRYFGRFDYSRRKSFVVGWPYKFSRLKERQQCLEQQLFSLQNLLENAPIGYLQVDEENQLLWCNQQARQMLSLEKWQPGQVRLLLEVVRSYELDRLIEKTRDRYYSQEKEWVFHPSCENAEAMLEQKSVVLRATGLPLPQGQVGVFLENRQQILEISQSRDRAFSDLAHELRTPLTSMRLVVETLQDRVEPSIVRWVNLLLKEVDRLIDLVQSWLDLTRLETNPSTQLNCHPLEIKALINSVWDTLEPIAQRQTVQLSLTGIENIWVNADKSRLHQVFFNLIHNSIKYSPPNGVVRVEVSVNISLENKNQDEPNASPFLEINIIDSGVGFAQEDLPYIFQRFYRGDKARSRSIKGDGDSTLDGSGLGLAIVHQILSAHGGTIKAMNHPQTGGAWLQIHLPQVMAESAVQNYI
ncbi:signal transduction histidine kinase [Rivularia sp. PCC 7116]|uniref:ATP-binding protein n=1 Tax=Rivularia sp. PCC 7116 TaxID=373994 RepID=UPI00029F0045|nr:ATP-binding protein [Rivularia sp. PCC 7116]AFY53740.1 signal transduction histidine kinase [Rivularia sp. PCC 7116]